jgi:excinuclease ABC subunit C
MTIEKEFLQSKLNNLPDSPGVYLMKDASGEILYIGKASSLKDRVRSYFQKGANLTVKTSAMKEQVSDIEWIVTSSDLEALILENNFIKKHKPKYNVILRDDKNYPYLKLSADEDFPCFSIVRRYKKDKAQYFGPYVPANALRETLVVINKIFPLRKCKKNIDGKDERPCLNYQIGRCLAPCCGKISKDDYYKIVKDARFFLEGKDKELLKSLHEKMEIESKALNFEEAARTRDRIKKIERVLEKQRITVTEMIDQDVIGMAREGGNADIQILFVRNGMMTGRKDFFWDDLRDTSNSEIITSFIEQFYRDEVQIPDEVLIPIELDGKGIEQWLSQRKEKQVHIIAPKRGHKASLINLSEENALIRLNEALTEKKKYKLILNELKDMIGLQQLPKRIEAFDISNISGSEAVGSMVVWEGESPKKSDYRRFKIKTVHGADDYGMMKEVLHRYYSKMAVALHATSLPDLVMIDGGRGQLNTALDVFKELGIDIKVIGIAKARGDDEKERIFLPNKDEPIELEPSSPVTLLLQRIRDESHRFAVSYHRKLMNKRMFVSVLDDIEGIGPIKKRKLLSTFESAEAAANAVMEKK